MKLNLIKNEKRLTPGYLLVIALFYTVLVGIALLVCQIWGINPFEPLRPSNLSMTVQVILGCWTGLFIIFVCHVAMRFSSAFRRLNDEFSRIIGRVSVVGAFILAASSGIAEEVIFRGAVQQTLDYIVFSEYPYSSLISVFFTSLIFALLHTAPNMKVFYLWTIFAFVFSLISSFLYLITGNLVASIVAHFMVNFVNLSTLEPSTDSDTI